MYFGTNAAMTSINDITFSGLKLLRNLFLYALYVPIPTPTNNQVKNSRTLQVIEGQTTKHIFYYLFPSRKGTMTIIFSLKSHEIPNNQVMYKHFDGFCEFFLQKVSDSKVKKFHRENIKSKGKKFFFCFLFKTKYF